MQPNEIAVIWMMYEEERRLEAAASDKHASPRPSFPRRFRGQLRRFAFRGQLGPAGGQAPA